MKHVLVGGSLERTRDGTDPSAMCEEDRPTGVEAGLTVIELLVMGALIATLAAIVVPRLTNAEQKMQITRAIADIRSIEADISVYINDHGEPPDTLVQAGIGTRTDPWGNPYRYLKIVNGGSAAGGQSRKDHWMVPVNSDYDLYSMGPDGESKPALTAQTSQDDIIRAADGAYVGPVSDF